MTEDEESVERLRAALKKEVERVLRYNFHDVCVSNNEEMLEDLTSVVHLARNAWDEYCQEGSPLPTGELDPEQRSLIQRFEEKQEKLSALTNELIESKRTLRASREAYNQELEYLKDLNWQMGLGKLRYPNAANQIDDTSPFTTADQEAYNRAVVSAMESGLKAKHKTELAALRLANVAEQKGLQNRIEATRTEKTKTMQEHAARVTKLVHKLEQLGVPLSSADRGELATAYRYLGTQQDQKPEKIKAVAPGEKDRGNKASRMSLVTKRMSTFENAARSSVLATMAGMQDPKARTVAREPKSNFTLPSHSGTAANISKDFRPSRDPLGSSSSFTSRPEISLPSPNTSMAARSLYATPRRKPKLNSTGADIPRVGCPPRRRCMKPEVAQPGLYESTMTTGSAVEFMGSARPPTQSMQLGMEPPQETKEEVDDGPRWVTRPHHMLQLGPCANGYCLRPAVD